MIAGNGGRTVSESGALVAPAALDASSVTLNVPVTAGVPKISPLVVSTDNPLGNPVAPEASGELLAVI